MRALAVRALVVSSVLVAVACASSTPAPVPAGACAEGQAMCSSDRAGVMQCQRGAWVPVQRCGGPRGCGMAGNQVQCDTGQPAAPAPAAGGPCAPEGTYECSADRRGLNACRGGRWTLASTCRGQRGCVSGTAVDCDHSVALVGDPCDGPKEIACSADGRALLRCSGGVYGVGEPCRNACLSTSGRVLCQ